MMNGAEDIGKVLLVAVIQIIISALIISIIYFVVYKPIKRYLSEYFQQTDKKDSEVDGRSPNEKEQAEFDYVSEADKSIKMIESKAVQASNNIRQKIEKEDKEIQEFITSKAETQIYEERDRAIDVLKKEYSDLVLKSKDKNTNKKTKNKHK